MSLSSMTIGAEAAVSCASTPALPMARSAFRHCRRVLVIGGAFVDGLGALLNQGFVVELHAVGRLVLDAVPQRLELLALKDRLPRLDLLALIGVLDLQLAGELAEDVLHLRKLGG